MTFSNKNMLIGAVVVIVLAAGIYMQYRNTASRSSDGKMVTNTGDGLTLNADGNLIIKEIDSSLVAPDFTRPIAFSSSVDADLRKALNANLAARQAALQANIKNFSAWIGLGMVYQMGGDYKKAEEIWTFASLLAPKSSAPFDNLGNLYLDYLKDYPKAERMFKTAVENDPTDIGAYRNLFSLYTTYGYKSGTSAAENIMKTAIAASPNAYDLHVLLARYYKEKGRTAEARAEYDLAISGAKAQDLNSVAADIEAEKATL